MISFSDSQFCWQTNSQQFGWCQTAFCSVDCFLVLVKGSILTPTKTQGKEYTFQIKHHLLLKYGIIQINFFHIIYLSSQKSWFSGQMVSLLEVSFSKIKPIFQRKNPWFMGETKRFHGFFPLRPWTSWKTVLWCTATWSRGAERVWWKMVGKGSSWSSEINFVKFLLLYHDLQHQSTSYDHHHMIIIYHSSSIIINIILFTFILTICVPFIVFYSR